MAGVLYGNGVISRNVFVNGGQVSGSAIVDLLGIPDTVGISDAQARSIIEGRAAEQATGNDPDTNEALEQFGGGSPGGTNPITGTGGAEAAPGSPGSADNQTGPDSEGFERLTSEWIIAQPQVSTRVLPEAWTKLENLAKSLGRPITINSAYRTPAYNRKVGGAKNSMHVQRKAIDIQWGTTSDAGRIDMIQRAIDAGFSGIGTYNSFMHVDIGTKRHWGSNGSYTGQFAQYKPVLRANGFANA